MNDQIREIAGRISALREIEEVSIEEMAKLTEKTVEEYKDYEAGKTDFSFSFLFTVANRLNVDITDILTGDGAKLKTFSVVKKGEGLKMERRKEYKYQHLAPIFKNRQMEPFLVTVEPKDVMSVKKHSHEGQEINYVTKGSMTMYINNSEVTLSEGDLVYFDATAPHAMKALNNEQCQFLAIITK